MTHTLSYTIHQVFYCRYFADIGGSNIKPINFYSAPMNVTRPDQYLDGNSAACEVGSIVRALCDDK